MNALNRTIQPGERLVQRKESMKPEYQELGFRVFVAESGFGMEPFTAGTKVFGYYECDNEKTYIHGDEISVKETEEVQRYKRDISLEKLLSLMEA